MRQEGFSANKAMRKQYMPLGESLPATNSPAITVIGITMTRPIKAGLIGMEWIQSLPWRSGKWRFKWLGWRLRC